MESWRRRECARHRSKVCMQKRRVLVPVHGTSEGQLGTPSSPYGLGRVHEASMPYMASACPAPGDLAGLVRQLCRKGRMQWSGPSGWFWFWFSYRSICCLWVSEAGAGKYQGFVSGVSACEFPSWQGLVWNVGPCCTAVWPCRVWACAAMQELQEHYRYSWSQLVQQASTQAVSLDSKDHVTGLSAWEPMCPPLLTPPGAELTVCEQLHRQGASLLARIQVRSPITPGLPLPPLPSRSGCVVPC